MNELTNRELEVSWNGNTNIDFFGTTDEVFRSAQKYKFSKLVITDIFDEVI